MLRLLQFNLCFSPLPSSKISKQANVPASVKQLTDFIPFHHSLPSNCILLLIGTIRHAVTAEPIFERELLLLQFVLQLLIGWLFFVCRWFCCFSSFFVCLLLLGLFVCCCFVSFVFLGLGCCFKLGSHIRIINTRRNDITSFVYVNVPPVPFLA